MHSRLLNFFYRGPTLSLVVLGFLQPLTLSSLASRRSVDPANAPLHISFGSDSQLYGIERKLSHALARNRELEDALKEREREVEVLRKQLAIRDRTLGLISGQGASTSGKEKSASSASEGDVDNDAHTDDSLYLFGQKSINFATLQDTLAAPSVWGSKETSTLARFVRRLKEGKELFGQHQPESRDDGESEKRDGEGLELYTAELAMALARERQGIDTTLKDLRSSESSLRLQFSSFALLCSLF
uniref:Uncharacterized protein n=1 Tax=Palpitomonas bilix TaxID=652834 RepID=A0A7S3D8S1_9EUKA|mmetsp:Transcript_27128/g.69918  ORF Transcript_27128/g.69918 Transcript_27128/m.69918 type:complete len:244 (+) Transcript_27128:479-1210(+)